ncbi:hypothetical protein [Mycoplasmopsis felis]|uniref:hypothetical protein n=1 Tax=Mycoplasmopsis felis TaxID=33923 RepID=UPI003A4D7672
MKKRNKYFLMVSSITAITSPIFISAACGTKNSEPGKKTEVVSKDNLRSKINEVNSFIDSLNDAKYKSVKDDLTQSKIAAQAVVDKTDTSESEVSSAKTTLEKALEKAKLDKLKVNLKELIEKAETLDQTALNQELKTKLTSKITESKGFVSSATSTKVEIQGSTSSLTEVIKEVELEILKNKSIEEVKVELQKSIDAAKELIDSMNESKYSEVKKELEAAKMHAEVAKSEENTTKEKLSQEKQTLDDAIEKAKRDKENLRETPSNVTTETKSFEETQYVYAFKDTLVKEALKSQIEQGWIFENLEEVSQQDNSTNTDNSNTSGTTGTGSAQESSSVGTASSQESNQSSEETPTSSPSTANQPNTIKKIDKLVKPGFETFRGKKLKEGSQTVYDYLNVVVKGITKTITYETTDLNTLSGSSNLEVVLEQSFNHNPTANPLSKVVDGDKGQSSRWDTWAFYGKEQNNSYITIKLQADDAIVNKFKLWTRVRGYNRGLQNNKALPTKFIKLYYSLDGQTYERVKNQDKEAKEQLFTLNQNGEIAREANDNVDYTEINFDPVKAKYIRFEFEAPEIKGIKGTTIPNTNQTATTNYGVVGFNEVELIKLTDSGKSKWENSNNIETYKNLNQINIPENIAIEFNGQNNILNSFLLDINNNSTKTIQVNDNIDLSTLSSTHITIKNRESENNSSALHDNLGVVIEEIQTQTLNNKIISKQFKITLIKDNQNKKVITLNVQHNN